MPSPRLHEHDNKSMFHNIFRNSGLVQRTRRPRADQNEGRLALIGSCCCITLTDSLWR